MKTDFALRPLKTFNVKSDEYGVIYTAICEKLDASTAASTMDKLLTSFADLGLKSLASIHGDFDQHKTYIMICFPAVTSPDVFKAAEEIHVAAQLSRAADPLELFIKSNPFIGQPALPQPVK